MDSEPPKSIRIRTPAKINLGLRVVSKRPDGYHEIETTFVAVDLYDGLRFERTEREGVELTWDAADPGFDAEDLKTDESNLIVRAIRLIEREREFSVGLRIHLTKRIPVAAGLGGGSSDAAAALVAVDRLYDLGASRAQLSSWAAELGSDVPFFLGPPTALGRGRGEILTPQAVSRKWSAVLVCPPIPLSARDIYGAFDLTEPLSGSDTRQCLDGDGFLDAIDCLRNDLQEAVSERAPVVLYWCRQLLALGARGAFVSGSGPTVVGVFSTPPDLKRLERLRTDRTQLFVVNPVTTPQAMVIG